MFPTPKNTAFVLNPFGSIMVSVSKGEYRYGFNGSEIDKEIEGGGNNYTTEYRLFDTRIAKFLSVDPLYSVSPGWSPYRLLYCNPLNWIDPSGLLEWSPQKNSDGSVSYISEEKDNMSTFKEQYGLTENQAINIFKKNNISTKETLKKGVVISGEKV